MQRKFSSSSFRTLPEACGGVVPHFRGSETVFATPEVENKTHKTLMLPGHGIAWGLPGRSGSGVRPLGRVVWAWV